MENAASKYKQKLVLILTIIFTIGVIAVSTLLVFNKTSRTIAEYNIETMREISLHDMHAISNSLDERFMGLHVVESTIKKQKPDTITKTIALLSENINFIRDVKTLELLSDDGVIYTNTNLIAKNDLVYSVCKNRNEFFAMRYYKSSTVSSLQQELLLLAIPVNLTIEGIHFSHLIGLMNINTIKKELKITSYNGEGFSSVIDKKGNYVVNISDSHSFFTVDNLFEDIKDSIFYSYPDINTLIDDIKDLTEPKTVVYTNKNSRHIMIISPLSYSDWYFITDIPVSVFNKQTNKIMISIYLMILIIILVVFVVVILLAKQHSQNEKLEFAEKRAKDQEALEKALNMANAANRAKTTFLNNMSHDIRTPMNAIIGFTGLAASHIDDKKLVQDYLTKIGKSSDHLLSLINDVLDMSRIESGKMTLSEKTENLTEILNTLKDIIYSNVTAKELNFSMDINDITNEKIICDRLRLNQVLLNILSNSIKYTQQGGTVSISLHQNGVIDAEYGLYEFRIKDNGMGMSEEFLKTIYEPFTRMQTSTVSGIQGTGLGMAITKNIVDMMGGKIDIISEEGKGTEVILNFEFKIDDKEQEETKLVEEIDFTGKKVLLVDDNEFNLEIGIEILKDGGFTVETANDGTIAVEKIENSKPGEYDLILMDMQMPVMDGCEATKQIRAIKDPAKANITIIAMTANAFEEDKQLALSAGMNDYLPKPVDVEKLKHTMAKYINCK